MAVKKSSKASLDRLAAQLLKAGDGDIEKIVATLRTLASKNKQKNAKKPIDSSHQSRIKRRPQRRRAAGIEGVFAGAEQVLRE